MDRSRRSGGAGSRSSTPIRHIDWVQLPWAGIEPYVDVVRAHAERTWTCGKGVYAEPVAEHALALALAGLRHLGPYAGARAWGRQAGTNLLGARVTILGGGGITESLLRLLGPFGCDVTVVRRTPAPMAGAARVVGEDGLDDALAGAAARGARPRPHAGDHRHPRPAAARAARTRRRGW